ncbi:hypothetical protein [Cytobacillus firmus]|uniref:hypothetical protein n=1 Tax=Cytobacillus firmus TaxID=1399 RepID=UPI0022284508|nr:hypothetical protein [Cytobacillus firmus]
MKVWISLLSTLLIGIILSYFFLDYNWTIHQMGENSESNGFLIVVAVSILIYVVWTKIERKKE